MNKCHTPAVFGYSVQQVGRANLFVVVDTRDRWEPRIVGQAYGKYFALTLRNIIAGFSEETAAKLAALEIAI